SSSAPDPEGKTVVAGIGSGRPCRRANAVATARTPDESLPPEKLTRQGPRTRAGRIACSSASRAVVPGETSGGTGAPSCGPGTTRRGISTGDRPRASAGCRAADTRELVEAGRDLLAADPGMRPEIRDTCDTDHNVVLLAL